MAPPSLADCAGGGGVESDRRRSAAVSRLVSVSPEALRRLAPRIRRAIKTMVSQMQPARQVNVAPFLLAAEPLTDDELAELTGLELSWRGGEGRSLGTIRADRLPSVVSALAARGWRLPSES